MAQLERLFEPERHLPLDAPAWDPAIARQAVSELADTAHDALADPSTWRHEDGTGLSIYSGAAGVQWALQQLVARDCIGAFDLAVGPDLRDCEPPAPGYLNIFAEYGVPVSNSFLLGPCGSLAVAWLLNGNRALLDRLDELIGANLAHPWMENLWGAPSTMLAALHLLEATGQERFAAHYRAGAEYLWERLETCDETGCRLWRIPLYGGVYRLLGAGHGFVGNAYAVLRGLPLLDDRQQQAWIECIADTVARTATLGSGVANWRQTIGSDRPGRNHLLVQYCHGAPGVAFELATLYGRVDDGFDTLLLAAGELTWAAGPLAKYPGLCHGTPGNGYAFLKLHAATGDERWLERARAFAMAALRQREQWLADGGTGDVSLWEGDMGLAMYLADCIDGRSAFPTMDYF